MRPQGTTRNFAFVAVFLGSACGTLLVAKPLFTLAPLNEYFVTMWGTVLIG